MLPYSHAMMPLAEAASDRMAWRCGVILYQIVNVCVCVIDCICVSHAKRRILNTFQQTSFTMQLRVQTDSWIMHSIYCSHIYHFCRAFHRNTALWERDIHWILRSRAHTTQCERSSSHSSVDFYISSDFTWIDVKWFSHIHVVIVGWVKERICEDNWPNVYLWMHWISKRKYVYIFAQTKK